MKLQGSTPLEIIKKIILFLITIAITFFVIFFLWIPLLILVCIFLLAAFVFRKRIKVNTFSSFGKKKNEYATWNANSNNNYYEYKSYIKDECVDAEYINLDKENNRK